MNDPYDNAYSTQEDELDLRVQGKAHVPQHLQPAHAKAEQNAVLVAMAFVAFEVHCYVGIVIDGIISSFISSFLDVESLDECYFV